MTRLFILGRDPLVSFTLVLSLLLMPLGAAASAAPVSRTQKAPSSFLSILKNNIFLATLSVALPSMTASAVRVLLAQEDNNDYGSYNYNNYQGGDTGYDAPGSYDFGSGDNNTNYNYDNFQGNSYYNNAPLDGPQAGDAFQGHGGYGPGHDTNGFGGETTECSSANGCLGGRTNENVPTPDAFGFDNFTWHDDQTVLGNLGTIGSNVASSFIDGIDGWFGGNNDNAFPDNQANTDQSGFLDGITSTASNFIDGIDSLVGGSNGNSFSGNESNTDQSGFISNLGSIGSGIAEGFSSFGSTIIDGVDSLLGGPDTRADGAFANNDQGIGGSQNENAPHTSEPPSLWERGLSWFRGDGSSPAPAEDPNQASIPAPVVTAEVPALPGALQEELRGNTIAPTNSVEIKPVPGLGGSYEDIKRDLLESGPNKDNPNTQYYVYAEKDGVGQWYKAEVPNGTTLSDVTKELDNQLPKGFTGESLDIITVRPNSNPTSYNDESAKSDKRSQEKLNDAILANEDPASKVDKAPVTAQELAVYDDGGNKGIVSRGIEKVSEIAHAAMDWEKKFTDNWFPSSAREKADTQPDGTTPRPSNATLSDAERAANQALVDQVSREDAYAGLRTPAANTAKSADGTPEPTTREVVTTETRQQAASKDPAAYEKYLLGNKPRDSNDRVIDEYKPILREQYEQIQAKAGAGAKLPGFDDLSQAQMISLKNRVESANGNISSLATLPVAVQVRTQVPVAAAATPARGTIPTVGMNGDYNSNGQTDSNPVPVVGMNGDYNNNGQQERTTPQFGQGPVEDVKAAAQAVGNMVANNSAVLNTTPIGLAYNVGSYAVRAAYDWVNPSNGSSASQAENPQTNRDSNINGGSGRPSAETQTTPSNGFNAFGYNFSFDNFWPTRIQSTPTTPTVNTVAAAPQTSSGWSSWVAPVVQYTTLPGLGYTVLGRATGLWGR